MCGLCCLIQIYSRRFCSNESVLSRYKSKSTSEHVLLRNSVSVQSLLCYNNNAGTNWVCPSLIRASGHPIISWSQCRWGVKLFCCPCDCTSQHTESHIMWRSKLMWFQGELFLKRSAISTLDHPSPPHCQIDFQYNAAGLEFVRFTDTCCFNLCLEFPLLRLNVPFSSLFYSHFILFYCLNSHCLCSCICFSVSS